MSSRRNAADGHGWQVLPQLTPVDLVCWTYSSNEFSPKHTGVALGLPSCLQGPFPRGHIFSDGLTPSQSSLDREDRHPVHGAELNPEHIGVKVAADAISLYERDVGFHFTDTTEPSGVPNLSLAISQDAVAVHKEHWDKLMLHLTGDPAHDPVRNPSGRLGAEADSFRATSPASSCSSPGNLDRSTSTLSSIDLPEFHSLTSFSLPATPKPKIPRGKTSPSLIKEHRSSAVSSPAGTPSKRLNASASFFVPKSSPSSKPAVAPSRPPVSFTNFTFPSLNGPQPSKAKGDDVFGSGGDQEKTPTLPHHQVGRASSALLPPFLHETFHRRKPSSSRTRTIVDRLRIASLKADAENIPSSITCSPPPSPTRTLAEVATQSKPRLSVSDDGGGCGIDRRQADDTDGWIGLKEEQVDASKARRTRDLFKALTRRRSDSSPSNCSKGSISSLADENGGDAIVLQLPTTSSSASPSPSSSTQSSSDGWIQGISPPPVKVKPRKRPTRSRGHNGKGGSHSSSMSSNHSIPSTKTGIQPFPLNSDRGHRPSHSSVYPSARNHYPQPPPVVPYMYGHYPQQHLVPVPVYPAYAPYAPVQVPAHHHHHYPSLHLHHPPHLHLHKASPSFGSP